MNQSNHYSLASPTSLLLDDNQIIERVISHIDNGTTDLGSEVWREPVINYLDQERFNREIKLFNALRGEKKSISELARLMNISRQAVHKTAHKLEDLGFLELITRNGNKKDRLVKITELGQEVRKQGAEHIMVIEEKLALSMGKRNLEFMRIILAGHSKRLKASD